MLGQQLSSRLITSYYNNKRGFMTSYQEGKFDVILLNVFLSIIIFPFAVLFALSYLPYKVFDILLGFLGSCKAFIIKQYTQHMKIPSKNDDELYAKKK